MLHSQSLGGVQDDRGNTGGALVGGRLIDAPGFEQRLRGGVGAARRDPYRPGMRSPREERSEGSEPLPPAPPGEAEEGPRMAAPPLMGLRAAKEEEAVAAIRGTPLEEFASGPQDVAAPIGPQPHLGPLLGQHEELLGVDPGQPG